MADVEAATPTPTANTAATAEAQPISTKESTEETCLATPPPPSYDSIFGKLKAERENTSDHKTFMMNSMQIFTKSAGWSIFMVITLILPIASIVVGSMNLHNCPVQRYIPIWMIVAGSTSALLQIIQLVTRCCDDHSDDATVQEGEGKGRTGNGGAGNGLLGCFNFAWFITGNVWVFGVSHMVDTQNVKSTNYCEPTTYYMAYWTIVGSYIFIGLFCCCGCCVCAALGRNTAKGQ